MMCRSPRPSSEHRRLLDDGAAPSYDVQTGTSITVDDIDDIIRSDASASSSSHDDGWWWRSQRRRRPSHDDDDESSSRNRRRYRGIFGGQLISFALSCANASSSSLSNDYRVMIPTLSTGIVYSLLSLRYLARRALYHRDDASGIIRVGGDDNQPTTMNDVVVRMMGTYSVSGEESNDDAITATSSSSSNVGVIDVSPPASERRRRPENTTADTTTSTRRRIFPLANPILRHAPWHTYAVLSVLDVEANYLAMLSFRHTTLSSSMLLTSLSVLSTVALRRLILSRRKDGNDEGRLGGRRMMGVVFCLVGGCSWLLREFRLGGDDDVDDDDREGQYLEEDPAMLYGDLLALAAACVYGLNDVLAECFLKASDDDDDDGAEYVGMIGLFGALFSFCIQAPLLGEWDRARILLGRTRDVTGIESDHRIDGVVGSFVHPTTTATITLLFLCFVVMLLYFYTSAMAHMRMYDSTSLNLSLQSGPLWAVVLTMIRKSSSVEGDGGNGPVGIIPPAAFFTSFAMILVGMFLYENNTGKDVKGDGNRCSLSKSIKLDRDYGSTESI